MQGVSLRTGIIENDFVTILASRATSTLHRKERFMMSEFEKADSNGDLLVEIANLRREMPPATFSLRAQVPLQKEVDEIFSEAQANDRDGLFENRQTLLDLAGRKIDALETLNGGGHPNSRWLVAVLRSARAAIMKDFDSVYAFAKTAEAHAVSAEEKAIALHNQASAKIWANELEEGIHLELSALRLWPANAGFWANLCEALYRASRFREAAQILGTVPDHRKDTAQAAVWKVLLDEDPAFLEMYADETKEPACSACRALRSRLGLGQPL
jgi:hypothetical protein